MGRTPAAATVILLATQAVAQEAVAQETAEPPAVEALLRDLEDEERRDAAVAELQALGPRAASATGPLLECLASLEVTTRNSGFRIALLEAIGAVAPYGEVELEEVREAVEQAVSSHQGSVFAKVRGAKGHNLHAVLTTAGMTLSRLEVPRDTGTEKLAEILLEDDNAHRRAMAAELLAERNDQRASALHALREALVLDHPETFRYSFRNRGQPVVSFSIMGTGDDQTRMVHTAAARAIAALATGSVDATAVEQLLRHGTDAEKLRAVHLVARVPEGTTGLADALSNAAFSDDVELAREAVTALGMLGESARIVEGRLERLTEHDDEQVRKLAAAALRQVRSE